MPPRAAQQEGSSSSMLKTVFQGLTLFAVSQFVISKFFGPSSSEGAAGSGKSSIPTFADRPDIATITNATSIPLYVAPIWEQDTKLDISIYVSPSLDLPPLDTVPEDAKVLDERNFDAGDWNENREIATTLKVPKEVQNNETLWAHIYVAVAGHQLDPYGKDYSTDKAYHFSKPLTQYLPKKKVQKLRNLLDSSDGTETGTEPEPEPELDVEEPAKKVQIGSFYHPNVTISVVPDGGIKNFRTIHPSVRKLVELERTNARDSTGQNGWYYPTVYVNTFWQLRTHMTELNSTVEQVPLYISLNNLKQWKFSLYASLDDSMKQSQQQAGAGGSLSTGNDGSDFEMVKEVLLDTNSYLLATTGVVSILHMVFEGLAFKNDIAHWRNKKDVVGTSVRTILANVFMQLVIFLYLLDNSEGTSWMILGGQGFGIVLEAWKITKTVDVRVRTPRPGSFLSFLPYHIVFEDKHKLTETEQRTKEYDEIAFKWLYIVAVPLLGAYAVYSLKYETHKSWYSFIIETLVGSVYAYGFLMMVPSLYINYRLKSVAHMPGKALTYKFLNTFIDDLFAFTIKMPTLHRLATLRDDIIFFIWVYQSWKYKVDYKRINEFGQGGDEDEKEKAGEEKEKNTGEDSSKAQSSTGAVQSSASGSSKTTPRKRK